MNGSNPKKLREIDRVVVAIILISSDDKILLGKKDPSSGGVYKDAWHTPGGGVEQGETLEHAATRECLEETGIDISTLKLTQLSFVGHGSTEKRLENGELVWCNMIFHRFEVRVDDIAANIAMNPTDDLVILRWFEIADLAHIQLIPGAKDFFIEAGYIQGAI